MELSRPFIRLPYSFDADQLQQELARFDDSVWMAHPNRLNGNTAIPLVSLNGEDNDEFAGQMQTTPHLERCDYMQQVMASFGEVLARSRLMRLAGNSEVSAHVDFNYHWYSRVRIHIPVTTTPDVTFYCGDEQINMQAGECWIFDSWRRHKVVNASEHDRTHLVIDTAGSSRFWQTIRSIESARNEEVSCEFLPYSPGQKGDIKTERYNVAPVMSPGELEAIAKELINDFTAHSDNDVQLVATYRELLLDLAKDWREAWHLYGYEQTGWKHYKSLLDNTVNKLHPQPRALITASNEVGVNPIIMQRILRAAFYPGKVGEFI